MLLRFQLRVPLFSFFSSPALLNRTLNLNNNVNKSKHEIKTFAKATICNVYTVNSPVLNQHYLVYGNQFPYVHQAVLI